MYFVDKCLPFGVSISCSHFQCISNGLRHIVEVKNRTTITNYLDDFLFLALTLLRCNYLLKQFLDICNQIGFPIAIEKTEWASEVITFLGILLNGHLYVLSLPIEKKERVEYLLQSMLVRNKTTIRDLQALCRYLNFLGRAIYLGCVFTRRMYAKYSGLIDVKVTNDMISKKYVPKPYHHVKVDREFKNDCKVWLEFITNSSLELVVNRPMVDLTEKRTAQEIVFYSDASAAPGLGFGCILDKKWIFGKWQTGFIQSQKPSIEYLELFALCTGILTWQKDKDLVNARIVVFCDNQAVVNMINNISSSCPNCMHLLRLLVLNSMIHNRRVFATYVRSCDNGLVDSLSRLDFNRFRKLGPDMNQYPDKIDEGCGQSARCGRISRSNEITEIPPD